MGTLSEHLAGGEPQDLAAQLPDELAEYLRHAGEARGEPFSAAEFFRRISDREGVTEETARNHAKAVIQSMNEMVSAGELEDVKEELPEDLASLIG